VSCWEFCWRRVEDKSHPFVSCACFVSAAPVREGRTAGCRVLATSRTMFHRSRQNSIRVNRCFTVRRSNSISVMVERLLVLKTTFSCSHHLLTDTFTKPRYDFDDSSERLNSLPLTTLSSRCAFMSCVDLDGLVSAAAQSVWLHSIDVGS
jgi:hypothetical protein